MTETAMTESGMTEAGMTQAGAIRVAVPPATRAERLRRRMHSPLCGLLQSMGHVHGGRSDPRILCAGGEMTGVHVPRHQPAPPPSSYHIGGYGLLRYESEIRTLGETAERYAGYMAAVSGRHPVDFRPYEQLTAEGRTVLEPGAYRFFTPEQLAAPSFPFRAFDPAAPVGWIRTASLTDGGDTWLPAQLFLVGYVVRDTEGEPWLNAAVTTGTAAHTTHSRALLGALHEAVQLDAAIGHWHGGLPSTRIRPDARTRRLERITDRCLPDGFGRPEYHWLPVPGLSVPGLHTVVCLLREPGGGFPAIVAGQGVDGSLEGAMYKALLEAAGVRGLAVMSAVTARLEQEAASGPAGQAPAERSPAFDLESNVVAYAQPGGAAAVEKRFGDHREAVAGELPPDDTRTAREQAVAILRAYREAGRRLYHADLTTPDLRALGLFVDRVWSPDTLSLPLPGAPAAAHPRFEDYGGFRSSAPHPYP
ncbi:YcaO-like family protein [Streptomyces hiroshimensis]|uniref:YcaO domain-containing protein n=1 Tax=Streptomyces hiroshimensis TaxID=66424 RepID=A0ABQ2YA98_9ACTN|nr:YcaO-like family protein [Streptomyces hiroshimensis]GGX74261.1 hypothetical protein GCM10010324_19500 [Streptomyces hiroshimensis]